MIRVIRTFMILEAGAFLAAASIHFGLWMEGYGHQKAGIAESVIGTVLLAGLSATWIRPGSTRGFGLAGQGFALLGTLVGIFTIAIGVGPRTVPDVVYHIVMVTGLVCALLVTSRWRPGAGVSDSR